MIYTVYYLNEKQKLFLNSKYQLNAIELYVYRENTHTSQHTIEIYLITHCINYVTVTLDMKLKHDFEYRF